MSVLTFIDQLRYMWSLLIIEWLFCLGSCEKRPHYGLRVLVSWLVCTLYALLFLLIKPVFERHSPFVYAAGEVVYWLLGSFLAIWAIWYCFEMRSGEAIFRGWTANNVNSIATVLLRSVLVYIWWPSLPERHLPLYLLILFAVYAIVYAIDYRLIVLPMRDREGVEVLEERRSRLVCLFTLLLVSLMTDAAKSVGEWLVLPLEGEQYRSFVLIVKYFSALVIIVMNTTILIVHDHMYRVARLRSRESVMEQLLREKAEQYESSRQNIELINRKCHDLKHQLSAMRFADGEERERVYREAEEAVMFYDAAVKTGNEALDTILTEKSLICSAKKIRLSCTVSSANIDKIKVVDLYTMLGNALDNAIECVERFESEEKKTIRLQVRDLGNLLYLEIENYYEQPIVMQDGLPLTRKQDKQNHGIGLKSIQGIARRYGGDIHIHTDAQTFLLQIVIPISG